MGLSGDIVAAVAEAVVVVVVTNNESNIIYLYAISITSLTVSTSTMITDRVHKQLYHHFIGWTPAFSIFNRLFFMILIFICSAAVRVSVI